MSLWQEIEEVMRLLDEALRLSKERGNDYVVAEAKYQSQKTRTAYEMLEQGHSATFISMTIKGMGEVTQLLEARDKAEVEYENAREARNVYKKKLDTLREQYAREWGAAQSERNY